MSHCTCGETVRELFAAYGIEVAVGTAAPLVPTGYADLGLTCPHGVRWYAEPTSDQIVQWARDGVA